MHDTRAIGIAADVTDRGAMQRAVATTVERFGGLDVVVANAGIASTGATMRAMATENFERVLDVNLRASTAPSTSRCRRSSRRKGHVVVIASVIRVHERRRRVPYAMSKAGVEQLGRALRARAGAARRERDRRLLRLHRHRAWSTGDRRRPARRHDDHRAPASRCASACSRRRRARRSSAASSGASRAIIRPRRWAVLSVLRGDLQPADRPPDAARRQDPGRRRGARRAAAARSSRPPPERTRRHASAVVRYRPPSGSEREGTMESSTADHAETKLEESVEAKTVIEAFHNTVDAHRDAVAVRTQGDAVSITWRELRKRVDALAAGLTQARPEARRHDRADVPQPARVPPRRPRGDDRRGDAVLALRHRLGGADRVRRRRRRREDRDHRRAVHRAVPQGQARSSPTSSTSSSSATAPDGTLKLEDVENDPDPDFDADGVRDAGRARRPADADLHVGHDRPAEGRRAHARQPDLVGRGLQAAHRVPAAGPRHLVAAQRARRRAHRAPLHPDRARADDHDLPGPAQDRRGPAARCGRAGSSRCRASGRRSRRGSRPSSATRPRSSASRPSRRSTRRSRRSGSSRPARRSPRSSPRRSQQADEKHVRRTCARRSGFDELLALQRRRGADAARGARVLPRDRRPDRRAVGDERDLRLRHRQPAAGRDQDRHRRPAGAGRARSSSPRTASCSCKGAVRHARLPQPAPTRRRRRSTPTAGCTPATSARSTTTATSRSSTARRS